MAATRRALPGQTQTSPPPPPPHTHTHTYSLDMPGNLTNGPDSATQDFATSAWRVRQLGFNSVRLPFRFRDLTKGEEPEGGVAAATRLTPTPACAGRPARKC